MCWGKGVGEERKSELTRSRKGKGTGEFMGSHREETE